jgi:murein DD-endopeptidase MepM/ murein hydrolase activator NlpD
MVAFANPVNGLIAAKGVAHPVGTFVVTSTFADHVASGRAPGVDIGNGGCGAPVIAMQAGTVSYIRLGTVGATTSDKASIVLVKHPNGWTTGYAHLKIRSGLALGQAVPEGYQLGTVDKIGATACHLHFGVKDLSYVEVDGWPLLRQNGAIDEDDGMDASFSPHPNRTVTVNAGARHRLTPDASISTNIAIASDPGGPLGDIAPGAPLALMGTVIGKAPSTDPTNPIWWAYWRPETKRPYYIHTSATGPETPWEATADCTDEVAAAVKPLNAKIANAKAALT